ncbi:uncharacterized protein F54H12.2-like [Condylostylus longicornis]|uniref:uncharacterized protein F54H12.2-like n=1 Tax=Condylostylus longicornis TaxID=2530218 RepID=UPI00244DFE87|nr:uncharacterized protein F54H12.2-like [Condylostylus longicornis]
MNECMKSELDLFATPPIQTNILKSEEVSYNPIASLDNPSIIEFVSLGHGDTYRDLSSTYIKLKVQILKKDGTAWHDDKGADQKTIQQPSVLNNILHSLIKQCNVQLNGKNITPSDGNYHYRAYIESLLNYGTDAATTHLECAGWILDKPNIARSDNNGSKERQKLYHNSNVVELMGKLHVDMFNQPTHLINNVDIRILFTLEKPNFFLFADDSDESQFKIVEAKLFMRHVTINPSVLLAHNAVLEKSNVTYHYKRVEVKNFTIPSNSSSISLDNVFIGQLPNTIIFCMTENAGYSGKRSKNPYNFKHFDISQFMLYVNGVQVPNAAIETSFSDDNNCNTRAYHTLFSGTGIYHNDRGHQITKSMFANGFFLLAFDLTPDASGNEICQRLLNQGTIRIEARLSKPTPSTLTALIYGEFDSNVQIDKNRNVYTNV